MNIIAGMPQGLAVVIIFLVVRAIAGIAVTFARPAGFVFAYAAGMMLSSFPGMTAVLAFPQAQAALELAAGLLLFSFAYPTLRTLAEGSRPSWTTADLARRLAVTALPVAGLFIPVLGNAAFPEIFAARPLRLGLTLVIAIWLSRTGRPLDLLAAAGAWFLMDSSLFLSAGIQSANTSSAYTLPDSVVPYLLLLGSGGLIFTLSRYSPVRQGSTVRNLARDGLISLSAMMALSLRLLGANWGLAALMTGIVTGFAGRNKPHDDTTATAGILALEAGLACSFAIGLGMNLAGSSVQAVETAIIVAAALVIPAIRGMLSTGTGKTSHRMAGLLPASAAPLAMILFAGMDGTDLRFMAFGLSIACMAALPSARFSGHGTTGVRHSGRKWKPLVAVSRRGNAAGILTFAYALADPDQPIRSVCVAATPGSQGPDAAEAEETLVRAVAAGALNGYRILPSMVTASSTADGLARAALERKSDCIVVGWNETPSSSDPDSRSIVDALVHTSPANVISVRKPEIFSQAKRLVFVTMAGSMTGNGYQEAAAIAVTAWGRKPSSMEVIVIGGAADELATVPGLENGRISTIPVWRELPEVVRGGGTQVPAFFVAAARPDWPGWNPGTQRIPLVIQDSYPESALAVFYLKAPPAIGEGTDDETGTTTSFKPDRAQGTPASTGHGVQQGPGKTATQRTEATAESTWPPIIQVAIQTGRIMTSMKEAVLIDAIATLTKTLFLNDRTAASRMASDFSAVARTEPIELAPGILLLHAHAKGIAVPALAIGVNRNGWKLVALEEPVRIVIMLVSPVEAGPAAHLEALTQIAKAIRDHGFAQAILDPERGKEFSPG
jgi:mannitol/fructose-specific phosphotransferase system IIA component (Ntr-type)